MEYGKGKNMSRVATAAADWNEDDETDRLVASIEAVLVVRYPASAAALTRDIRFIIDLDRLRKILQLAKTSNLADIRAAIESAVPPPK